MRGKTVKRLRRSYFKGEKIPRAIRDNGNPSFKKLKRYFKQLTSIEKYKFLTERNV